MADGDGFECAGADEVEAGGPADPQAAGSLFDLEQNESGFVFGAVVGELGDGGGYCVLLVRTWVVPRSGWRSVFPLRTKEEVSVFVGVPLRREEGAASRRDPRAAHGPNSKR